MKLFKSRVITREDGRAYLKRWYILRTPLFRIRLHHIMLSDYDCLHDHPWNFVSIILKGGYVEARQFPAKFNQDVTFTRYKKYGPGKILFRKAEDKHRLIINKPAWTLVFMLKRRREWGFWTKKGFVPWFKYVPTQSCE